MEPIVSSETSAIRTQTPGNYPKRNKLHLEHGESLKTKSSSSNQCIRGPISIGRTTSETSLQLHTPRTTDYRHTIQDRRIETELSFTLAKNATKPNPFKIIPLQTTRKYNSWKTEEAFLRAAVTVETERIKGSDLWCLLWWWWWWWWWKKLVLTYIINFITLHRVFYNCVLTSKTQARYNSCMNLHASHSLVKHIFLYPYTKLCMCLVDRVSIACNVVTDVSGLRSLSFFGAMCRQPWCQTNKLLAVPTDNFVSCLFAVP